MNRLEVGKLGEKIAANYLQENGYEILDLNYQNARGYKIGEIDIIAQEKDNGQLVFIEVKARLNDNEKDMIPEMNITKKKLDNLFKAINCFLKNKKWMDRYWRLDSIGVILNRKSKKANLKHIKSIRY